VQFVNNAHFRASALPRTPVFTAIPKSCRKSHPTGSACTWIPEVALVKKRMPVGYGVFSHNTASDWDFWEVLANAKLLMQGVEYTESAIEDERMQFVTRATGVLVCGRKLLYRCRCSDERVLTMENEKGRRLIRCTIQLGNTIQRGVTTNGPLNVPCYEFPRSSTVDDDHFFKIGMIGEYLAECQSSNTLKAFLFVPEGEGINGRQPVFEHTLDDRVLRTIPHRIALSN
jgi:hypothetical protein